MDAKAATGAGNYTLLGKHCYGVPGEIFVNFAISTSQIGFTIGYIYFIKQNLEEIF
jgi:amino acid permease